jgi:hypothetical protein
LQKLIVFEQLPVKGHSQLSRRTGQMGMSLGPETAAECSPQTLGLSVVATSSLDAAEAMTAQKDDSFGRNRIISRQPEPHCTAIQKQKPGRNRLQTDVFGEGKEELRQGLWQRQLRLGGWQPQRTGKQPQPTLQRITSDGSPRIKTV